MISRPTQTVLGLKGLVLHLNALEIYPEDSGMGTPMLFEYRDRNGYETMTWACGYEGGNLCEIIPDEHLHAAAQKWTDSIAVAVGEWETYHWNLATAAAKA